MGLRAYRGAAHKPSCAANRSRGGEMRAMSITRPLLGAVVALSACAPDRALERGTRRPTSGEVGGMHAVPVLTIAGDSGSGHPEFLGVVDAPTRCHPQWSERAQRA